MEENVKKKRIRNPETSLKSKLIQNTLIQNFLS